MFVSQRDINDSVGTGTPPIEAFSAPDGPFAPHFRPLVPVSFAFWNYCISSGLDRSFAKVADC